MAKAKRQEGQGKQEQVSHVSQYNMYCSGEENIISEWSLHVVLGLTELVSIYHEENSQTHTNCHPSSQIAIPLRNKELAQQRTLTLLANV